MPARAPRLSRIARPTKARPRDDAPSGPRAPAYVFVSAMASNPTWRMDGQKHAFSEMILVYRGSQSVAFRPGHHPSSGPMGRETAASGEVLLYPAGLFHSEASNPRDPVETVCVAFRGAPGGTLQKLMDREGHLRLMGRWLYETRFQDYPGIGRLRDAYVAAMVQEFRRLAALPAEDAAVGRVRSHIHGHLPAPLGLSDLAAVAGMSRSHFCRRYHALTGRTPMEDLWRIRLEEARALILSTRESLGVIARETGFSNPYHFSRKFRQVYGMAPGSLRKGADGAVPRGESGPRMDRGKGAPRRG